jgi:signal transduction histidine kinase
MGVKNSKINPALISAFRVFTWVMLLISLFPLLLQIAGVPSRFVRFLGNPFVTLVEASILLVYLSIPWIQEKLGRIYLPVAIGIATLAPVVSNFLTIDFSQADELAQVRTLAGQWEVIFLLFVPLILVSWQYGFKVVVFYCLGLAVLDLLTILPGALLGYNNFHFSGGGFGAGGQFQIPDLFRSLLQIGPILLRTAIYLLVGFVVARLVASQREQTARLEQAYHQLAAYATTNEQLTLSRERNRLARELHDTLAHTLSAVAVQLEAISSLWDADREKAHDILNLSLKLTRDGLNETRRAIQSLRAAPVEDLGLVMALSNLARSVAERNHFNLELELPDEIKGWSPEIEHTYYRITEEALRNVAQHSGAQKITIALQEKGDSLALSIHDDGHGFDLENVDPEQRFGLQGMKERTEAIGGRFSISTLPNQGTTIQVHIENHHT